MRILQSVLTILEDNNVTSDTFINFMNHYVAGDLIYPDALHRALPALSMSTIYKILNLCVEQNLLGKFYDVRCVVCNRSIGKAYKAMNWIPEYAYCPHCNAEIHDPKSYAIIVYQML